MHSITEKTFYIEYYFSLYIPLKSSSFGSEYCGLCTTDCIGFSSPIFYKELYNYNYVPILSYQFIEHYSYNYIYTRIGCLMIGSIVCHKLQLTGHKVRYQKVGT